LRKPAPRFFLNIMIYYVKKTSLNGNWGFEKWGYEGETPYF
jgi:hypothetical protein